MISNNNRPVINKIANRIFQSNKNRNFIAIIAIVLTTVLFTTIFTMGFELLNTVKQENIRKAGGDGQVVLSNITDEVYENVKDKKCLTIRGNVDIIIAPKNYLYANTAYQTARGFGRATTD